MSLPTNPRRTSDPPLRVASSVGSAHRVQPGTSWVAFLPRPPGPWPAAPTHGQRTAELPGASTWTAVPGGQLLASRLALGLIAPDLAVPHGFALRRAARRPARLADVQLADG